MNMLTRSVLALMLLFGASRLPQLGSSLGSACQPTKPFGDVYPTGLWKMAFGISQTSLIAFRMARAMRDPA